MAMRKRTDEQEVSLGALFENLEHIQNSVELIQKEKDLIPKGWQSAHWRTPCAGPKERVTVRLDREVLDWYRKLGRGWQARLNDVLRCYQYAMISKIVEQPGDRDWKREPL